MKTSLPKLLSACICLLLALSTFSQTTTTATFNYTGSIVTYTVPAGVTKLTITAKGARGGGGIRAGLGASMQGDFTVTPGQVLRILVGQEGRGFGDNYSGGGGTFVANNATNAPLIVAGGGGGASCSLNGLPGNTSQNGTSGNGGAKTSLDGGGGINGGGGGGAALLEETSAPGGGGGAGFYGNGGRGISISPGFLCIASTTNMFGGVGGNGATGGDGTSTSSCTKYYTSTANSFLSGGQAGTYGSFGGGGAARNSSFSCSEAANGGGGGYSGGGGGLGSSPGGGGGSFNAGINQVNASGVNNGNGQVVIVAELPTPATALKFDPSLTINDNSRLNYVSVNDPFEAYQKEITVEFWMYTPNANLPFGSVMGQADNNSSNNTVWLMHPNRNGTMTFYVNDAGTLRGTTGNITANAWHHYAAVASATSTKFYVDGVLVHTGDGVSNSIVVNPSSVIHIGKDVRFATRHIANGDPDNRYGTMILDELRIWNRALCQEEINANKNVEINPAGQNGLQQYYRFNQGFVNANNSTVTTLTDLSGNNRNGTLNNFTLSGIESNWVASGSTNTGIVSAFVSPTAAIQGGANICIGQSRTLTNSISGGNWTSSNTAVATINATTGQVTTVSAGTTTITYTTACGGVSTLNFTVNPLPTAAIAGTNTICSGSSTTLTATGGGTYVWNTVATTASITVTPTVTTNYSVTVTSAAGCTAPATRMVTVLEKPIVTANSNSPVPSGNNLQLSANGAFSYVWSGPNGFNSTAQNPVINNVTSAANGTYSVTGTNILGCTNTASVNVTVLSTPATALKTDGVDDHVTINNPFKSFNKAITVEFWMNTPTGRLAQGSVMGQSSLNVDGMSTDVWLMHPDIGGTNLDFYVNDAGTWRRVTVPIRVGGWHHYVGVASEFGTKFYVDGVLEVTGPGISTGILNNANSIIQIGKDPRHTNFRFADMSIDEVRIWSRALCADEIINNKNCELNPTGQNGLQEYYRFNQGFVGANNSTETTLTDLSGNNRHGTLSGFALTGNNSNWVQSGFVSTANCSPYVAPIAPIVGNISLCIGSNTTLTNANAGGRWISSNTGVATINNTTGQVTTVSAGTTTITYTTECGGVSTATLTVNALPVASIAGTNTICSGGSTVLTASGGTTYLWNTGATTAAINVSPTATTTYSVTATSAAGCVSTAANRTVTVISKPSVTASSNSPITAGGNLQLSSGGAITYSWTGPNGFTSAVQNPVITGATTAASGVYTVTGFNASGCSNTATVNVTVLANPATALHTDGVNDYVAINNPFRAFNKEITVEFWMNTPNAIMPYGSVMGQATSGVDNMSTNVWLMHPNTTGGIDFLVNDAGTWRGVTVPIQAGGWHHYVGVASEFGTKFYVDGVLEATGPAITTGIVNNANSVIHIGKDVRHNTGRFGNITVDEVRIWSRVLCEGEINNSRNCELNPSGLTGLQQYYRFNQGFVDSNNPSETTLIDASGNGRDGQLNDFALTGASSNWVASGSTNTGTCTSFTPPTAPITGTTYICIGTTGTLSNAIPGGLWSSSHTSVATINANTGLVTSVSGGTTTITYKNECGGISTINVVIVVAPTPTITTPVGGTNVCPGNTVTLNAPQALFARYQWYKDGVEISGTTSRTYTATVSGIYTVARTVDGCISPISNAVNVTIADTEKPVITCPSNQALNLDASCNATLPDYRNLLTASDNCTAANNLVITQSPAAGTIVNGKGALIVTFTVTDASNNSSSCTISVDKKDVTDPVITCPANINVTATSATGAVVNYTAPVGTDNCSGATTVRTAGLASGSTFPIGTTTVTYRVTDAAGLSTECSFTITVVGVPPAINCPSNITVDAAAGTCGANVNFAATETTAIPASSISYTVNGNAVVSGANFPVGTTTVVATATNAVGSSSCSFTVTVVDNQKPTITAPAAVQANNTPGLCAGTVTLGDAVTVDNCGVATVTNDAPATFPVGSTTVTWTVTDIYGNTATATQTVVIVDNEKPTITAPAAVQANNTPGLCTGTVTLGAAVTADNCGVATLTNDAPATFPVGSTTVTWTVTDIHGNTATATQIVVIVDNEKPTITAPVAVQANNTAGLCTGTVTLGDAVTADNCGVKTVTNDAPATFPVGSTTVTWTVTDIHGNTATATQTVVIVDNEKPTITAPAAVQANNTAGLCTGTVTLGDAVTADNCGVKTVTNDAPATFPVGSTTVTWTVTDIHGNTTTATQTVVIVDSEKPTITAPAAVQANNTAGLCTGSVTLGAAVTADNCGVAKVTNDAPATFPVGSTTVTWTVTDIHGNTATATQTVVIVDNEKPTITAPTAVQANNTAGLCTGTVTLGDAVTADNCGVKTVTNDAPATFPVGSTTVTWTVTDIHGNTATATQTVVIVDNEKPTITAPAAVQANNTAGLCTGTVTLGDAVTADNCGVATVTNDAPATFPVGSTTVTWTVTDIHGNTAKATQTVVIVDNEKPTISATNISVNNDAAKCGASIAIAQPITGDNCGVATVMGVRSDNELLTADYPVGTTTITWTVRDIHGNMSTTVQTIVVVDNEKPVIACAANQVFCANTGGNTQYTIPALGQSDNCGITSTTYAVTGATNRNGTGTNASGSFAIGTSTITFTVTDIHGNVSTCSFTVTINPLPVAGITVQSPDALCNQFTLTGTSTLNGPFSYQWLYNNNTKSTTQQLSLGLTDADGIYSLYTTDVNGCRSEVAATYNYQKQNLSSSYTIIATKEVKLGQYNKVETGSVGVTSSKGEADFKKYSSVTGAGAFVKAKEIDTDKGVTIANKIYAAATVTLPTMQYNTTSTRYLQNVTVNSNTTTTLSGNYKDVTLKKGSNVTLNGTIFGRIKLEEGANVRFTSSTINLEELQIEKGPKSGGYSYIRFAPNTSVRVSKKVTIGSDVIVNPEQYQVTFYMGDNRRDEEKFHVKGDDTRITANIFLPDGKLKVTGGNYGGHDDDDKHYSKYGKDDDDDDDDKNRCDHRAHSSKDCKHKGHGHHDCDHRSHGSRDCVDEVYMTGLFIAEEVESEGKHVIWNNYSCSTPPAPVTIATSNTSTTTATEEATKFPATAITTTTEAELKVTVMPNPSRTYFTLKIESKYEAPVTLRVVDASGRVIDSRTKIGANSTIQIGHGYNTGSYFAELIQGNRRKVIQLIKIR